MNEQTRRAVVYIAARLADGRGAGAVYDYERRRHFQFSGAVDPRGVNVYDFDARVFIGGAPSSLYHFGDHQFISLTVSGSSFHGYDFGTHTHFSGSISGSLVTVHDAQTSRHHRYGV